MKKISIILAFVMIFSLVATPLGPTAEVHAFPAEWVSEDDLVEYGYDSGVRLYGGIWIWSGDPGYVYTYVYTDEMESCNVTSADTYPILYGADKTTPLTEPAGVVDLRGLYMYRLKVLDSTQVIGSDPYRSDDDQVLYYQFSNNVPLISKDADGFCYQYVMNTDNMWYTNLEYVYDLYGDSYTGLTFNYTDHGLYYVRNGVFDPTYTGLIYDEANCFAGGVWRYCVNGVVAADYTGLICDPALGWWYVRNGAVDFSYNGLVQFGDNWWCVANGAVCFDYTGLWYDPYVGWWYVENGAINFGYNGLVFYDGMWWCVAGGRVANEYTGLWSDPALGWWYVENGSVNFAHSGLIGYGGAWWCVADGAVRFDYTGLWSDAVVGWWYVQGGMIDFGYSGNANYDGLTYIVQNGQVVGGP